MMMMYGGWAGLLIFILIIYFIISLTGEKETYHEKEKTPLDILNERYAKGEMTDEEYLRKKKILKEEN